MRAYTRQPQIVPRINWSNSLTKGLHFVAVGGIPVDLVNRKHGTVNGTVSFKYEKFGRSFSTIADAGNNRIEFDVPAVSTNIFSFGSIFRSTLVGAASDVVTRARNGVSGDTVSACMVINGAPTVQINFGDSGFFYGPTVITDGKWYVASGSTPTGITATGGVIFIDGLKEARSVDTDAGSVSAPSSNKVQLNGKSSANDRQLEGGQALSVIWTRKLSDAEHLEFYKNPWQLFENPSNAFVSTVPVVGTTTNRQYSFVAG